MAAEAIALGRHGRRLRAVADDGDRSVPLVELDLGAGDYDVEAPDLTDLDRIGPHPSIDPVDERGSWTNVEPGLGGCECAGGSW